MDLLSPAMRASMNQSIDDIHDTLAEDIIIINEVANVVISDSDDNFNAFSDRKDPDITYTSNQTTIKARVKWVDKAEELRELIFAGGLGSNNGTSIPMTQNYGVVRIKVKSEYIDLVKQSTKIIVSGQICQILNNFTPHNLVNINYVVFYLARQN